MYMMITVKMEKATSAVVFQNKMPD